MEWVSKIYRREPIGNRHKKKIGKEERTSQRGFILFTSYRVPLDTGDLDEKDTSQERMGPE